MRSGYFRIVLRVNLGCGRVAPEGWANIDRSPLIIFRRATWVLRLGARVGLLDEDQALPWPPQVIRHDITKGLPFETSSVSAVYSSHTFEHLYFEEAQRVTSDVARVLAPDGIFRLAFPDVELALTTFLAESSRTPADAGMALNVNINSHPMDRPRGLRKVKHGFSGAWHRWQPTRGIVTRMLERAGFVNIQERGFLESEIAQIEEVEVRPDSYFVEAKASSETEGGDHPGQ